MLKRRYGDRSDWTRIIERRYAQQYVENERFTGYMTLLDVIKVSEPLIIRYGEGERCIVDDGYQWLFQFPEDQHHTVTTTFNSAGEIVQWYIDICVATGLENGVPWMDDLFLDIVILPTGQVIVLDEDELDEALANGVISKALYELAWKEVNRLLPLIERNEFGLLELAYKHREVLEEKLDKP
ncbi:DUF402 domain-containing protein [Ornithinibacillus sp. JPR2-1]|uniref:DUF402 domain-containing protein n=1 Tax=Ornithinibacillus sp. JPR2-1 TaxID=2094019 RepID=UPI0031D33E6F